MLKQSHNNSFVFYTIIILALLNIASGNLFAQGILNFPVDTIIKDGYYNYRSLVKYDNDGFLHIVNSTQFDVQSNTREIYYRTNKTGTFVTTRISSNTIDDNYATIDFDKNGKVHIGWERKDGSNNFQLIYTNNRNTSSGFGDSVWITTGGSNKATPFMCVGKKDSLVHFVYYTFVNSVQDYAYYRNYNYFTGVLSQEYQLGPAEAGSENDCELIADTNGVVHITYVTNTPVSTSALKYFTFSNGTLTEFSTGIAGYAEYPEMCLNPLINKVYIIYRLSTDRRIYLISRNSNGTFTTPQAITPSGLGYPSYWRGIDVDESGRLFVTYQNSVAPSPKGFFLIYGSPGSSFSSPLLVWQDSVNYSGRGSSSVTAKGDFNIAVAFDPTALRNGNVVSDIFIKKGILVPVNISENTTYTDNYELYQNFPNPFNPVTLISFNLLHSGFVELSVFDVLGRKVASLVNGKLNSGRHTIKFDGSELNNGVYFYKIITQDYTSVKRMILLK